MLTPFRAFALICLFLGSLPAGAQDHSGHPAVNPGRGTHSTVSALPLSFERNIGQAPQNEAYLARSGAMQIGFSADSLHLQLPSGGNPQHLDVTLVGASIDSRMVPSEKTGGESNYLLGNRPSSWKTHIPQYARLTYGNVYPGVDLTFYGTRGRVEHDFVVQPGADYRQITVQYLGAENLALSPNGDLHISMGDNQVVVHAPNIYQEVLGRREQRAGRFVLLARNEVSFQVDDFDATLPLVIDPVLNYATYLADQSLYVYSATVDSSGNTYIAGLTFHSNYPVTQGAVQIGCSSCAANKPDVFITKLNPEGTAQIYSTFLGGSDYDTPTQIAVDSAGDAIVTGYTQSADFPMKNPITSGSPSYRDGFVTSLSPDGASLNFSSRLGGTTGQVSADTFPGAVATDASGDVFVSGITESAYLPVTPGAVHAGTPAAPNDDYVFLTKLQPTGSLVYSAILGATGSASQCCAVVGIGLDSAGDAYVAGTVGANLGVGPTTSPWPITAGAYQSSLIAPSDAAPFAAKVSPDGSKLLYSTLVTTGIASGMALTANQDVILVGTPQANFPLTSNAFSSTLGTSFIAELSADGTQLPYASYFSTPAGDTGGYITNVALDAAGDVWIGGNTGSITNIPVVHPIQSLSGNFSEPGSAFVSEFDPQMHQLLFSTYFNGVLGGSRVNGLAIDTQGRAHVVGTGQDDLPTTPSAYLASVTPPPPNYFYSYGFAALIDPGLPGPGICFSGQDYLGVDVGSSEQNTITITNCGTAPLTVSSVHVAGTYFSLVPSSSCAGTLAVSASCNVAVAFSPGIVGFVYGTMTVTSNAPVPASIVPLQGQGLSPSGPAVSLSGTSLDFGSSPVGVTSSQKPLIVYSVGQDPLTLNSIAASGDFAVINNCGTTILSNEDCTLSLTFTPTAGGARTGTLTITDNATGSPQTVALTGQGEAVSVSSSSPALTVASSGGSATATIQLSPQGGFTGTVNLTCAVQYQGQGTPANSPTCSLNPAQVQVTGSSGGSSTLTVSTAAANASIAQRSTLRSSGLALAGLFFAGILPGLRRRKAIFLALALVIAANLSGCGGGGNSAPTNPGTTTGKFQVVLTATSGTVTTSTKLPLTVQ